MMANGTKPAQLTAIGLEPVLNPAMCRRPARIASISAAVECTREKHDLSPGHLRQVVDEAVPYLGVDGRVLDRRIGEDQRRRVDPKFWIGRRIGDEIAVAIAIGLVEVAARTVLGVSEADRSGAEHECREKCRDGFAVPRHGPPFGPSAKSLMAIRTA